ncbi:MAG: ATP-binding protein [Lachnospiraceae bacterium]|nr:ATP-binding protein [Lachnospiraceae bacterium]
MDKTTVRLSSIRIHNIKNVENGMITMPNASKKSFTADKAEILGIYGQNGSGKTAVVDVFFFLQKIMIGDSLDEEFGNYIEANSDQAEIQADFNVFKNSVIYEISYHIYLKKIDQTVIIEKETLSSARNEDDKRSNKIVFMNYDRNCADIIFTPKKRLDELAGTNKEILTDLIVAKKLAEKSNCSYIFGESSREVFNKNNTGKFGKYAFLINSLFYFALRDLFVIRNSHSGVITANFILPMAFRIDGNKTGMKGDFVVPLTKPVLLNKGKKEILEAIVEQINTVLYTIIPGLMISIKNYGPQLLDSGEDGWKVELMSHRDGRPDIPIRMESEGIIKIISILNALIQAFGNPSICLVIDELDAGIFEYMLGELLEIFQKSAKGQLIFTSHNLRALEMLETKNIIFSTANPNNRYIRMKNVGGTNNLRNLYIRSITLGGQDEVIYEETDSLKIARAFRKAGRSVRDA